MSATGGGQRPTSNDYRFYLYFAAWAVVIVVLFYLLGILGHVAAPTEVDF